MWHCPATLARCSDAWLALLRMDLPDDIHKKVSVLGYLFVYRTHHWLVWLV